LAGSFPNRQESTGGEYGNTTFLRSEIQEITNIKQITPITIREYILWLEVAGHNPGGRHAHYRAIRSLLYWYEDEVEPEGRKNPIKKVKAPIIPDKPLEPVSIETINKLLDT
jgi:hypothetical protein